MASVKSKKQKTGEVLARRVDEQSTDAQRALHENEQRLRLALDAGRMGTWDWELGTDRIQWSDGHYTLLGYTPGEVKPSPEAFNRRVHPEDRARQQQSLWESVEQHREYLCEFRVIWPDGSVHWLEARGRCIYDDSGAAMRTYGVLTDIDARKRSEEALRESEQRFRGVLENSLDVAYRLDLRTKQYDYISPLTEQITGFMPEEIESLRSGDLFAQIHPDDVERVRGEMAEAVIAGRGTLEYRFRRKDGRYCWIADHFTVQKDEQGRPAYVSGIARDITGRKRDEEALRASEYRYRKLFEADLVGVYLTGLDGRILDFNDTMMAMLGYKSREECFRMRSPDFYANPEVRDRLIELLRKDGIVPGAEAVLRHKDGSDVHALGSAVLLVDGRTGEPYIQGVAIDITKRRRAEETLRESEERYHRLFTDDLTGNFIATPAGAVIECNPAFAEIYGLAGPPEAVACDISRLNPADWTELMARLRSERKIRGHQCMHRRPDGKEIWVVANVIGHFTPAGELTEIRGYVLDDTERRRAEQALQESERRFKSTFENAAVGIAHVSLDGRFLQANGKYCQITQYPHDELLTKKCLEITHPDDVRESIDNWRRLRDGQIDHYSMEKRYIRKDGSPIWVSHTGSVQRNADGTPTYFIVIVQDISWRKYAEETLRQSEQRFRKLFDADLMGVYVTRADGTFLDCNEKMVKMLGYDSREEVLGHRSTDFYVDPEFRNEAIRVLQRDGIFPGREGLVRRKDGAIIHVLGFAVLLKDEHTGEPYIQGVAVDITERKRAEEALVEAKEWNERNAARLDAVFRQMTEGLVIFDPAGNLLDMNRAALAIHGFNDAAELRGHLDNLPEILEMFDLQGRPLPTNEWPFGRALRGETFQSCEVRVRCRQTGKTWIASYGGTPVRDQEGRLIFAIVTLRDITAQKEAERQLRELTATLESKVAERTAELEHRAQQLQKLTLELSQTEDRERKHLAEILHDDLQQQLAAAKFHAGMLSSRIGHDPSLREIAAQIGQMLKGAIQTSRSLSHELSPAVMYHGDLGETFEWLAGEIRTKHGLIVHVHTDGEVISQSESLKIFLYRTAQELLFNVVKHARISEAGIRVRRQGRSICLMVSDRGRGFDPQGLKAIPGFGLFSIQERVQLLGGRMRIKSANGKGSTFFIAVPDEVAEPDRSESEIAEQPLRAAESVEPAPAAAHPQQLRVLIADDHEIVRQGLVSVLAETPDIEVVGEAGNGREAVDLAHHLRPDVVIMDVAMPLMDGDEATRQIRRHLPGTRVVALSMYGEASVIERMRRAGAEAYVVKTAPSEELLAAIRNESPCSCKPEDR